MVTNFLQRYLPTDIDWSLSYVRLVSKADLGRERDATFLATSGALGPIFLRWI